MAKDLNCKVEDLMRDEQLRQRIKLQNYISETVGLPTLNDILKELAKPGLDPREQFEAFSFSDGINAITDLHVGMTLPGIITNITAFGAFVDIGVHQDGLVHLSQMSDRFIENPNEAVKVQQKVMVTVVEVDIARKRIALSMKSDLNAQAKPTARNPSKGDERKSNFERKSKATEPVKPVAKASEKLAKKPANQSAPKVKPTEKSPEVKKTAPAPEEDMATLLAKLKTKFR
jgi:uncharacterized protein